MDGSAEPDPAHVLALRAHAVIIVAITLHNFMSYGDATLDLAAAPVACLAGPNGSGKSALLDAITWALWESARSSSDELMRLGEREMWVDLRFFHEGQIYRVRRSRQKSAGRSGTRTTSKGTLEFQISQGSVEDFLIDTESGSWRSLTGSSMRDTQRHISELLRMDYDTFINSAYLRQGKVDEFTTRPPSERKQVLGEILGLSYYDRLQEQARDHARQLKARKELLEQTLSAVPEIKQRLTETEDEFKSSADALAKVSAELLEMETKAKTIIERLNELTRQEERLDGTKEKLKDAAFSLDDLAGRKEELSVRLSALDELVRQSPEIEEQARLFDELKTKVEKLDQQAIAAQDLSARKIDLQSQLATMRSRLELRHETVQSRLLEIRKKKERLEKDCGDREKIEESYRQYKELLARESDLSEKQEAFTQLTERANDLSASIAEWRIRLEAQITQKDTVVQELKSILESESSLADQDRLLKDEVTVLESLEAEFELVEQKGLRAKADLEAIDGQIAGIAVRQKENLEKVRELKEHDHTSICPLCCAPIVDRAAVINRYLAQNSDLDREIAALKGQKGDIEEERATLRKQYLEIKQKLEGRKDLDKRIGQLNEKQLAVRRAGDNLAKAEEELFQLKRRLEEQDYAQIERESLVSVKAEIHKIDFDAVTYSSFKGQVRAQRHIEGRYQQLKRDLADLDELKKSLPALEEEEGQLISEIKGETYGEDIRLSLSLIREELDRLSYDRDQHLSLKQQLNDLIPALDKVRDLRRAVEERPSVKEAFEECCRQIDQKSAQMEDLKGDLDTLEKDVRELPATLKDKEELSPAIESLRERREETAMRVAVLESQCETMSSELTKMKERTNELKQTESDIDDYVLLAESFGKKGIQAVIIENAVPEIETDANRILSKLTDCKMHVGLITQHKTKSGGIVETLDLMIGDEVGTRNYELYSGGEAFKVNFAIRVALSRLLARRSGAKLETLIIDEGFGSQDEVSRDRLVKAIRSIQSDFARILVITHIQDIKEMFPVQIQVTKRNGTSELKLLS